MTDPTEALVAAVRAQEQAAAAHERLDRMNGSLNRLGDQVAAANGKLDTIALTLAREAGAEEAAKQGEASRYYTLQNLGIFVAVLALVVGIFGILAATHVI